MENNKEKDCNTCKNKGLKKEHWFMVILAVYILFSSIYGTIQIFKNLF